MNPVLGCYPPLIVRYGMDSESLLCCPLFCFWDSWATLGYFSYPRPPPLLSYHFVCRLSYRWLSSAPVCQPYLLPATSIRLAYPSPDLALTAPVLGFCCSCFMAAHADLTCYPNQSSLPTLSHGFQSAKRRPAFNFPLLNSAHFPVAQLVSSRQPRALFSARV